MMRMFLIAVPLAMLLGCSRGAARVLPPEIDAHAAGEAAISQYDANKNGTIEGNEFAAVPALRAALAKLDQNGDSQVSGEEIAERIETWQRSRIGLKPLTCRVTLDGKPLANATVEFIPEKFLGPAVKPALGTTGPGGSAMCTIDDADLAAKRIAGVQCGFYKVAIRRNDGKQLPSKYNTATTLGEEVAQDARWVVAGMVFDLKSNSR